MVTEGKKSITLGNHDTEQTGQIEQEAERSHIQTQVWEKREQTESDTSAYSSKDAHPPSIKGAPLPLSKHGPPQYLLRDNNWEPNLQCLSL